MAVFVTVVIIGTMPLVPATATIPITMSVDPLLTVYTVRASPIQYNLPLQTDAVAKTEHGTCLHLAVQVLVAKIMESILNHFIAFTAPR
jgi:hypothetical protein